MTKLDENNAVWMKASFCANTDCVEVALVEQQVLVRSSKNIAGPTLRFDFPEWMAFVTAVRAGEFDLP